MDHLVKIATAVTTVLMNNYLLQPEACMQCSADDVWKRPRRQRAPGKLYTHHHCGYRCRGECACMRVCTMCERRAHVLRVLYASACIPATPARGRTIIKWETSHPAQTRGSKCIGRWRLSKVGTTNWTVKLLTGERNRETRSRQRVK